MTSECTDGRTPAGGAYSIAVYIDEDGREVEPDAATRVIITEYDSAGEFLAEASSSVSVSPTTGASTRPSRSTPGGRGAATGAAPHPPPRGY